MTDIAMIVCSADPAADNPFPGHRDNCRDCGKAIFVTDSCEREVEETGAVVRPICSACGKMRFGDELIEFTPHERELIKNMGGEALLTLLKKTPLSEVHSTIEQFMLERQ